MGYVPLDYRPSLFFSLDNEEAEIYNIGLFDVLIIENKSEGCYQPLLSGTSYVYCYDGLWSKIKNIEDIKWVNGRGYLYVRNLRYVIGPNRMYTTEEVLNLIPEEIACKLLFHLDLFE